MSDIYFRSFKAHGKTFTSREEAEARIKEINEEIFVKGVSDGRLTEWIDIEDALKEAVEAAEKRRKESEYFQWKLDQIRETERELRSLEAKLGGSREEGAGYPIHRITWLEETGNRRVSRYSTDTGFLKAYLRMIKNDVSVWDAV